MSDKIDALLMLVYYIIHIYICDKEYNTSMHVVIVQ